jgi:hypothetical protein
MALPIYGALVAAYAYYVWLLGHLGWQHDVGVRRVAGGSRGRE